MAFSLNNACFVSGILPKTIQHGFGTKQFVNGYKLRDSEPVLSALSLQLPVIFLSQTHSSDIAVLENVPQNNGIFLGDGILTKVKNVILTVRTADCVPIIFSAEKAGIVGISHQGWKGTYAEMAVKMVQKMVEMGANIEEIKIAIGPTICSKHYPIDGDRLQQFKKKFQEWSADIVLPAGEKYGLDLSLLNKLQLMSMGIPKENIDSYPGCTYEQKADFYSYRRDNTLEDGEMLHYVWLR